MEGALAAYFDASLDEEEDSRRTAEEWLYQASQQPTFVPATMNLLAQGTASPRAQHAAAIFLKNICHRSWRRRFEDQYVLPDEDKEYARGKIFECMLVAPDHIRNQLKMVVMRMLEEGWPEAFPDFKDKIIAGLEALDDERKLSATLIILYQLAKKFKFSKLEERVAYDIVLNEALPHLYSISQMCLENTSADVLIILKLIIKVYHTSAAYILPSFIIEPAVFNDWMQLLAGIVAMEIEEPEGGPTDDWPDRPAWKLKKWACRTLHNLFQRYGTPSHATREYKDFAQHYADVYSMPILELMWEQVQRYKTGVYIAPRVLTEVMRYLENALEPAATWKVLKPLIPELLSDLLFPLLCFSEADHELWTEDPAEYIRRKLELTVLAEINSPDIEAAVFLQDLVKIRMDAMMDIIFQFIHNVLTECADPSSDPNPTAKDGALLMTSVVGQNLIESSYKPHLEELLVTFVFPEFQSPHGFLRARACQVFHNFSQIVFSDPQNVVTALEHVLVCLQDDELPVRVQAAVALRCLLVQQPIAAQEAEPHVTKIVGILLSLLQEAESDDLAGVLDKLVELYEEELIPHSNDLLQQLIDQFGTFISNDLQDEEVNHLAMAAIGTLNTIQSIVMLAGDDSKLLASFEVKLLPLMRHIIQEGIFDFIEEILDLMTEFTDSSVSEDMWVLFPDLHAAFRREMVDFFEEFCPVLYNYARNGIGKNNFPPEALDMTVDICRTMFERPDEIDIWRACKIVENVISWGNGNVDDVVPAFVGLAVTKLLDEGEGKVKGDQLIVACINVVLSALRYNAEMLVVSMETAGSDGDEPLLVKFFALWFTQRALFTGYHNRKLGILALSALLELPYSNLPVYIQQVWPHIVEMALFLFDQFEHAETLWFEEQEEDDGEDDDAEQEDVDEDTESGGPAQIDDEEDYIDDDADLADLQTLAMLGEAADRAGDDDEMDTGEFASYPTAWDMAECDAWQVFAEIIDGLEERDSESAAAAFSAVTPQQQEQLEHIVATATERASKK